MVVCAMMEEPRQLLEQATIREVAGCSSLRLNKLRSRRMPPAWASATTNTSGRRRPNEHTLERVFTALLAQADTAVDLDWVVAVDSTVVRAHQHAAARPFSLPVSNICRSFHSASVENEPETGGATFRLTRVMIHRKRLQQEASRWRLRRRGPRASRAYSSTAGSSVLHGVQIRRGGEKTS